MPKKEKVEKICKKINGCHSGMVEQLQAYFFW